MLTTPLLHSQISHIPHATPTQITCSLQKTAPSETHFQRQTAGFTFSEAESSQRWSQRSWSWQLGICPSSKGPCWHFHMWLSSSHHPLWITIASSAFVHAFACMTASISNHQTRQSHSLTSVIDFVEKKERMHPSFCDIILLQGVNCHLTQLWYQNSRTQCSILNSESLQLTGEYLFLHGRLDCWDLQEVICQAELPCDKAECFPRIKFWNTN